MSARTLVVAATTAAATTAVVAMLLLGGAVLVGARDVARAGLLCLFAVPVVRNAVVVVRGGRSQRALAVVGMLVVLVVGAVAFVSTPLDRTTPALPTSTR